MPTDKNDPAFKSAVADAVKAALADKEARSKAPKNWEEAEDRISKRVVADLLEALGAGEEEPEGEEGNPIARLFFGGGKKASGE